MLDNELYKALKVLREAQEWRMKTIEPLNDENGFVLEKTPVLGPINLESAEAVEG